MNTHTVSKKHRTGYSQRTYIVFMAIMILSSVLLTVLYPYSINQDFAFAETGQGDSQSKDKPLDRSDLAALLNGQEITIQDVLKRYNLYAVISRYSEDKSENLKIDSYLNVYMMEALLLKEAGEMGIKVTREEIEKQRERYLARNDLTEKNLQENLDNADLTTEDLYRYFENNLILSRVSEKKFSARKPSDEEAKEFYSSNYELYNRPEKISVSHILLCHKDSAGCASDLTRKEAKGLADNIQKIATPENFAELARRYSSDRTGSNGGDLGEISRGSAVPAFEKAAFSLKRGEISSPVETDFGFHIIYVRSKQKARAIKFEEAKESVKRELEKRHNTLEMFVYSQLLLNDADIEVYTVINEKLLKELEDKTSDSREGKRVSSAGNVFNTFRLTDKNECRNSKGQPIIMLFSTPDCPHCTWVGETFDETAMEYAERGLIEAHHYDVVTKDDLLTPEIEKEIPERYLRIYEVGSKGYVPYFSFGCIYDRISNGYERENDLYAEEVEMRQVIDSLVK